LVVILIPGTGVAVDMISDFMITVLLILLFSFEVLMRRAPVGTATLNPTKTN
jgi:hypothetical protein